VEHGRFGVFGGEPLLKFLIGFRSLRLALLFPVLDLRPAPPPASTRPRSRPGPAGDGP